MASAPESTTAPESTETAAEPIATVIDPDLVDQLGLNNPYFDTATVMNFVVVYGLKLLSAIAIFMIGKWLAKKATRWVEKMMNRSKIDPTLSSFAGNILYIMVLGFVVIAALSQLGVETTSLAAVIAAAGLAIGLALQGSLSNFAAGVLIIFFRPFKNGDFIEAAGMMGTVEEINIFTTHVKSLNNQEIIVPNAKITSDNIINYSRKDTRRIDLTFGIGYDDDIRKAKDILAELIAKDERILDEPEPQIMVSNLGESSVDIVCRPWVSTADWWDTRCDLLENAKIAFDNAGISIPYPQRDLHVITGDSKSISDKAA